MYLSLIIGEHSFFQVTIYGMKQIVTISIQGSRSLDRQERLMSHQNHFMRWMNFEPGMIPIPTSHDASIETQEFMGAIIGDVYHCKSRQAELRGKISSCTISSHLIACRILITHTSCIYPLPKDNMWPATRVM